MTKRLTEKYVLLGVGTVVGIAYGVFTRVVFGQRATLVSLTYLFLIPTILGMIPLVFASEAQLRSYRYIIFIPWITVASFFLALYLAGYEGVLCLVILGGPFFILGTVGAWIFVLVRLYLKNKKTLLVLMIVPFLLSPVEESFEPPSEIYTVTSSTTIAATPDDIWENIIRVPEISDREYHRGVFNFLGVPCPMRADLVGTGLGAARTGHFQQGLIFNEHITDWQPGRRVAFDIEVDPATIRSDVFDQHVLRGGYFRFIEAAYELEPAPDGRTTLRLVSKYRLTSKVNFYNRFWGDLMLRDFQDRLLAVIKLRCDH